MGEEADADWQEGLIEWGRNDATPCLRKPDANGWWICHRCGSMWSDKVSGLGWLPLSCPERS